MPTTGGKILLLQPVAFASGSISIGDYSTFVDVAALVSTVVGPQAAAYSAYSTVSGQGAFVLSDSLGSTVYGSQCAVHDNSIFSSAFGNNTHVYSPLCGAWGIQIAVGLNSSYCFAIGAGFAGFVIGDLCSNAISVGTNNHTGTISFFGPVLGTSVTINIGTSNTIGDGSLDATAIGFQVSLGLGTVDCIAVGKDIIVFDGTFDLVAMGRNHTSPVLGGSNSTVALGTDLSYFGTSNVIIGQSLSFLPFGEGSGGTIFMGNGSTLNAPVGCIVLGNANTGVQITTTIIAGYFNSVDTSGGGLHGLEVVVGHVNTVTITGGGTFRLVVVGTGNTATDALDTTVIGQVNTVADCWFSVVVGNQCAIVPVAESLPPFYSVLVGQNLTAHEQFSVLMGCGLTSNAPRTITMGINATNSVANTMLVGDSGDIAHSIHSLTINGFNGGALYTLIATDSPGVDEAGLVVTYNNGVGTTNKTLKAAVAPPVGSLLAYFDP